MWKCFNCLTGSTDYTPVARHHKDQQVYSHFCNGKYVNTKSYMHPFKIPHNTVTMHSEMMRVLKWPSWKEIGTNSLKAEKYQETLPASMYLGGQGPEDEAD